MSDDRPTGPEGEEPSAFGIGKFPQQGRAEPDDEARIRAEYGWLRGYYKSRPSAYREFQRSLNEARIGLSYDVYLARSAWYAVASISVGVFLGLLVTLLLIDVGFVAAFENPLVYRGGFTQYLGANRTWFAGAAIIIVSSSLAAGTVWYARYYYPSLLASRRRRNIDVTLPHAIVMMYALSHGGMGTGEIIKSLARKQDTYGEVANEFEMVYRDLTLFGSDLYTALRNARNTTVSDSMEQFFDDMLSVLDAGGDLTEFYEDEIDTYLEDAREEQERFIETLGILSEFFIALFVAAPLFVIVILIVISLLGGDTLGQLQLLVYVGLPLGMLGFLVLLDTISEPYKQSRVTASDTDSRRESLLGGHRSLFVAFLRSELAELREKPTDAATEGGRLAAYMRTQRRRAVEDILTEPLVPIRRKPVRSMVVTVPLAVLALAVITMTGVIEPTPEAIVAQPLWATTLLAVVPIFIVTVPLSILHEARARRERKISMRFSEVLNVISSANRMGIKLVDALELVTRWTSGPIADELAVVRNDIRWNYDTQRALEGLADRLRSPSLSRTIRLIAEGTRTSTELSRVLSIAAEDTRERFKIERKRRGELSAYIAVVLIGFLVYLLVIVLLDASYLRPIETVASQPTPAGERGMPLSLQNIPVEVYQTIFFHSALIQAFGIGILSGKLASNSVLSGLKYSIALITISLLVFLFV